MWSTLTLSNPISEANTAYRVSHDSETFQARDRRDGDRRDGGGHMGAEISNAVVSLFSEYLGRGPTRARTVFGRDMVAVVLEETFTKSERRLVEEGEEQTVVHTRRVFQQTMRTDLTEAIERITGRRVTAFLSDQSATPDAAVEVFLLEPEPHDGRD
jgi:uncharacterized protein YbcI